MQKDQIYTRSLEEIAPFRFDETVAAVFPDMLKRSVPGYALIQEMIGIVSKRYAQQNTRIYDLGCSLGASCISMLPHIQGKQITLIGIDNSTAMIEQAEIHLAQFIKDNQLEQNYQLRCEDVETQVYENASIINLNFTLQFIQPASRQTLINNIFKGLHSGGILILSEKISFDNQKDILLSELHHDFKRANGYSELEISQKRSALENVLIRDSEAEHLQRLKLAGFSQASLWFQCFNFCSFIAIKS